MVAIYRQVGGSPDINTDPLMLLKKIKTVSDIITDEFSYPAPDNAAIRRLLGLALENHVEDDIVRDSSGNKTSSFLYCYDTAAHATAHVSGGGGGTGLIGKYQAIFSYSGGRMTLSKFILQEL